MASQSTVYIIDAEERLGAALRDLLRNYHIQVIAYESEELFLSNVSANDATGSCLLLALESKCEDGLPIVERIRASKPTLPIIVLCDSDDKDLRDEYVSAGAIDVVSKSMIDAYVFTRLSTTLSNTTNLPVTEPSTMSLADGTVITFRMITPADAEIERNFVNSLSDRSKYLRFFSGMKELPDYMLKKLVDTHFPISYALIAVIPTSAGERQIGVARYVPTKNKQVAEFAVVVADEWQGHGIASQLLRGIITAATVAGIYRLEGLILRENEPMLRLASKFGFEVVIDGSSDPEAITVVKALR